MIISKVDRSASVDSNKFLECQRVTLPNSFHLTFHQSSLRLRHLTQIIGCNLENFNNNVHFMNVLPSLKPLKKPSSGYYFTLESSIKCQPNFTSEFQYSNSPSWESFDCSSLFPVHLLSLKGIIIRVWYNSESGQIHHIATWGVHFSGLVPLSISVINPLHYPPNTLIFRLKEYFYTSYDCLVNLQNSNPEDTCLFTLYRRFSLPLSETKASYSVSSLSRFHSTKRAIKQQEEKQERLREQLEYKGLRKNSKKMMLKNEIENKKVRLALLAQNLTSELSKLRTVQLATENLDSENQDKGIELLTCYQHLNKQLIALRNQEEKLSKDFIMLQDIASKVKDRRLQLLSQLPLVFPMEEVPHNSKHYTICDVHLPDAESYSGHPDDSLSVALGYVSQLLVKMAHMLSLPLKYPISIRGSLPFIADLTSAQFSDVETQFPLYTGSRDREKLHFNYGVFLFNKNIAQLRLNCGLLTPDLRPTLLNVSTLLDALQNQRAFMPDTVLVAPVLPASLKYNGEAPSYIEATFKYSSSLQEGPSLDKGVPEADEISNSATEFACDHSLDLPEGHQNAVIDKLSVDNDTLNPNIEPLKALSRSLDKGLDYLETSIKHHSIQEPNQLLETSKINTGSCLNLGVQEIGSSDEGAVASFHEQTMHLLKSWHEDNPTPYTNEFLVSSSTEKLAETDTEIEECLKETAGEKDEGIIPHDERVCVGKDDSVLVSKNSNNEMLEPEILDSKTLDSLDNQMQQEIKLCWADLGVSEASFFDDMTSRTANLASKNCTFKFTCRQTPPDQ